MAFSCPHCSEGIDGVVTQETLTERLKAKDDVNDRLQSELRDLRTKASGYDAVTKERDDLRATLEAEREVGTRRDLLRDAGLDPGDMLEHFELVYNAARASNPELGFADWFAADDGARGHMLLAPHFKPADPGSPPPAPAQPTPRSAPPDVDANTAPPASPGGRMTPTQLRAEFQRRHAVDPQAASEWMQAQKSEIVQS